MIDFGLLEKAYADDGFYSLQLEVGDKCYQNCIYCYMNAVSESKNELTNEMISNVLIDAKELGISAIEWLGGEPLLRPEIFQFMEQAKELGFRNNMWTGGLVFGDKEIVAKTAESCKHGLISFHLSTINPELYETLHPGQSSDDMEVIINGVQYLMETGYPSDQILNSVTFTGLQTSDSLIETMEYFYENFSIQTSINVYHTYLRPGFDQSELSGFIPQRKEVSRIYKKYKSLINAKHLPMNCVNKQYCSATLAVLNNGYVTPCATIREEKDGLNVKSDEFINIVNSNRDYLCFKYLKDDNNLPADCQKCALNGECWGCRSRSYAIGNGMYGKDPRCFRSIDKGYNKSD